ncbi:MAG: FtsX-like permease family protein [Promethearchaeia archaeon]
MSLDFALKDFYRKRTYTFPLVFIIALIVAYAEFIIYFANSLGLNFFIRNSVFEKNGFNNEYFFSGAFYLVYSQFNLMIEILVLILVVVMVSIISTSIIISKKRDIAIMKALGTIPQKLYGFYLLEVYIIFIISFIIGLIIGLISFGIFALIMSLLGYTIIIQIDLFYTPILFISCLAFIFLVAGLELRKIGMQNIVSSFSKEIPYNFDASKPLTFIPKWLARVGLNIKMAVINTIRRKNEFKRYLIIFTLIFLTIFTLALGAIVLGTSSEKWVSKSQGDNIIVIGHKNVIDNYKKMYEMFSNPSISITEDDINFTAKEYIFNYSIISNDLNNIKGIEKIDERLIIFSDVEEIDGIHYFEDDTGYGGYKTIGQGRKGNIPIIGINQQNLIQNFEIDGRFFSDEDAYDNMTIGDGLAYNFFDYPFDQKLKIDYMDGHSFHICGVIIDTFYSGYAGYVNIDIMREDLGLKGDKVNIILIKYDSGKNSELEKDLKNICSKLGDNFNYLSLDDVFQANKSYIGNLIIYPGILIFILILIFLFALYNYQKAGLMEKAKDFLIMKAIGAKKRHVKRILFFEAVFIIIPSILIAIIGAMVLNSVFLFDRVYLPPFYVPLILAGILFIITLIINYLSLFPLNKRIERFSIKDFEIY